MFILPIIVAFFASILTFFSWFWIGTILLPVFAIFFPLNLAIAMTWIVHLLNNFFKFLLVSKYFDKKIAIKLWVTWIIWSFLWALLFLKLSSIDLNLYFSIFHYNFDTNIFKVIIWSLLVIFSILEILPSLNKIRISNIFVYIIWFLSWLFWWLSWHQGALRTLVLTKLNLDKNAFIATWVVIALAVDITRIGVYFTDISIFDSTSILLVALTTLSAFLGAYIWKKLLKKVTINFVKILVSIMLIIMWFLMILGII